jgi:hypothetical protein
VADVAALAVVTLAAYVVKIVGLCGGILQRFSYEDFSTVYLLLTARFSKR